MQKYFATKSRNLHLNSGANVVRFAPLFKCKSAFRKSALASADFQAAVRAIYEGDLASGGTLKRVGLKGRK
jgi:hypothetical protein